MIYSDQLLGDLIRWGYQPLAVAGETKRPVHLRWQSRSVSLEEVMKSNPQKFALRMGDKGLQAIDVDIKNAEDPQAFLQAFRNACAAVAIPWNKLIVQTTLSGGVHLVYRTDNPKSNQKLSKTVDGKVLIETRGVGGCIVIYELDKFRALVALPTLSADEERLLLSVALAFDCVAPPKRMNYAEYNDSVSCVDLLVADGWTVVGETDIWYEVLRPGNTTSTSSGKVFKDTNRAYIWSTSTSLPAEESLTPAALTCHLKYDGEWSAFSRSINGGDLWVESSTSQRKSMFILTDPNATVQLSDDLLPKPLLGPLWQEGELTVLFGPTNTGKSVLAVDIADALAHGSGLFDGLLPTSSPKRVLYVDFELSEGQFATRYKGRVFGEQLVRATPDYDFIDVKGFRQAVVRDMLEFCKQSNAEVLIVDNLSNVNPDNTQAGEAAILVQDFRRIKNQLGISIMLIGHTPKIVPGQSVELANLAGSAQLTNLIDSCFALNRAGNGQVYIKQLKQRNDQQIFGSDNVILGKVHREDYVHFRYLGQRKEADLLSHSSDFAARDAQIRSDYDTGQFTQRQLAERYGIGKSRINEIIKGAMPPEDDSDSWLV